MGFSASLNMFKASSMSFGVSISFRTLICLSLFIQVQKTYTSSHLLKCHLSSNLRKRCLSTLRSTKRVGERHWRGDKQASRQQNFSNGITSTKAVPTCCHLKLTLESLNQTRLPGQMLRLLCNHNIVAV